MSRLLRSAGTAKKIFYMALHRSLSGQLEAARFLGYSSTIKPHVRASRRSGNEQCIPQPQRRLTNSADRPRDTSALMTETEHGKSTQSDVKSRAGSSVRTLEPHLYVSANTFQKRDNLLVLDLLNTAFRRAPSEDQQFLDVGCAVGDFTRDVLLPRSSPCWRIVGTDVSSSMIAYAERFYSHPRITYDVLDLSHDVSPFVERYGRFDRVYSFFCLHWIRDQVGALRNIRSLMTPEGECLLQFCARTPVYTLWRDFALMDRWKNRMSNIEDFIPPSQDADDRLSYLESILAASALRPHTCEVLRNVWTFPSEQAPCRFYFSCASCSRQCSREREAGADRGHVCRDAAPLPQESGWIQCRV
ncbi:hypothetical protein HPB51_013840 [Rhipicephalus microplus]|uniref:Methyltransferase type 12 domain-containing protein n=1 Tax=Rhipicephalus microplus TaxID=6941 RepID=A0A9J6F3P8_RHIMP|nr:hypothetical protein HPB51_013840 [Rhipicephalus microplus]